MSTKRLLVSCSPRFVVLVLPLVVALLISGCENACEPVELIYSERSGSDQIDEFKALQLDPFPGLSGFRWVDVRPPSWPVDPGPEIELQRLSTGFFDPYESSPMLIVDFSDEEPDTPYDWSVETITLPSCSLVVETLTGVSDNGHEIDDVIDSSSSSSVPVLVGFSFKRLEGDHELDKIRVMVRRNERNQLVLGVSFQDKNYDDPFEYRVTYAMVPESKVRKTGVHEGRYDNDELFYESPDLGFEHAVLQGFELDFTGADDYEIHTILVQLKSGVRISYTGFTHNPEYDFRIWWANLKE